MKLTGIFQHRMLKGNKYVTGGRVGERVCKKTGEIKNKDATITHVKGSVYTNLVPGVGY